MIYDFFVWGLMILSHTLLILFLAWAIKKTENYRLKVFLLVCFFLIYPIGMFKKNPLDE